jgi:very-short-patch-repair endonuclease
MKLTRDRAAWLQELLEETDSVLDTATLLTRLTVGEVRWRVSSGCWQQPFKGAVVAHNGPLTDQQVLRLALLRAGPGAVLAGLTAARLDGLRGFGDKVPLGQSPIHVINPSHRRPAGQPGLNLVVHLVGDLDPGDIHPVRQPRRTRVARSLVDAAAWMPTERGTMAILAAGVQQRLASAPVLRAVVASRLRLRRRRFMAEILGDIEGGAEALSELDFLHLVVRAFKLPEPDCQVPRRDDCGRRRWLDVTWENWKVVAEIDGAQHEEPLQRWDDMDRDIDLQVNGGYIVLRIPAWVVRRHPAHVAHRIREALRKHGCPFP